MLSYHLHHSIIRQHVGLRHGIFSHDCTVHDDRIQYITHTDDMDMGQPIGKAESADAQVGVGNVPVLPCRSLSVRGVVVWDVVVDVGLDVAAVVAVAVMGYFFSSSV